MLSHTDSMSVYSPAGTNGMLVVMAIAWKGAKGKARMPLSDLIIGGIFSVFPGDGQGS